MANVTITQLPAAGPITGQELVPIVQDGQTVQTTTAAISASPAQFQTFLTLNQEPTLPNSRALSGSTGVGLVDGGALSTLQVVLNGASGSLEASGQGLIAKTGGTVTPRQIVSGSAGLQVTNGTGISGNPSIALTGAVGALAGLAGTGILGIVSGSTITGLTITGTTDQINVANGSGPGNPTISISNNPTLPGTGAALMPGGTTAERPVGVGGKLRFNSQTGFMEYYTGSMWANLSAGASVANNIGGGAANEILVQAGPSSTTFIAAPTVANTFLEWDGSAFQWSNNPLGTVTSVDVDGGTTGLTYSGGPITTSGTITMAGTLITSNGGTGLSSYTVGDTLYYAAGTALSRLSIGANGSFMTSNGSAPVWSDPTTLSVGTATNVAGGAANQLVFNTGSGVTSFVTAPTVANTYLEWSGSAFQWSTNPLGTVTQVATGTGLTGGPITTSGTISVDTNGITDTLFRQSAGLSVVGRSANTTGNVADITAATDGQVLRRSGTSIGFGAVNLASADAITGDLPFSNLAQGSALSVLGVTGNATADNASIVAGTDNQVLRRSGTSIGFGALNLGSSDAVTGDLPYSNLAQGAALSVLGVTGNAIADVASIAAGSDHQVLRRSGTSVAFGAIALNQANAITGTLPIANGGTNATATPTAGAVSYGTGTAYAFSAAGTSNQVLLSGGTGAPTWSNQSALSVGTATNSTNATNATNTAITNDTTTNATMYPTWVTGTSGNLPQKVTSTKFTFNPSTGAAVITGGISGGTF